MPSEPGSPSEFLGNAGRARATELRTAILNNSELKIEDARRRADAIFNKNTQPGLDVVDQQRQFQQRETEKLLRLRALRLAKEATDREAQASSGGRPMPRPRSKRLGQIGKSGVLSPHPIPFLALGLSGREGVAALDLA